MRKIRVGPRHVAIVDDSLFEFLNKTKWHYQHGYARSNGPTKDRKYMHRVVTGNVPGLVVDHINGNKLDNRKENLRICSQSTNGRNRNKNNQNNTSGTRGVSYDKARKKWRAHVKVNYKQEYLGRYKEKRQAIVAVQKRLKSLDNKLKIV